MLKATVLRVIVREWTARIVLSSSPGRLGINVERLRADDGDRVRGKAKRRGIALADD